MSSDKSNQLLNEIEYVIFETMEGKKTKVHVNIIKKFYTLKTMFEDTIIKENEPVKLNQVSGTAFDKMIQFAEMHLYDPPLTEEQASKERRKTSDIRDDDSKFIDQLSQEMIFELIFASNYLDFRCLLDLLCKKVANMIKNKSVDEIRETFNIKNDFTPQEEENLKQENLWLEKC